NIKRATARFVFYRHPFRCIGSCRSCLLIGSERQRTFNTSSATKTGVRSCFSYESALIDAIFSSRRQITGLNFFANDSSNRCGVWGHAPALRRDESFSTEAAPRRPSRLEAGNRSCRKSSFNAVPPVWG